MTRNKIVIISPVRNEGKYLQGTIGSMVAQSLRPKLWVLVNDGSTDDTAAQIDAAAREHSWIKTVHRKDRGARKAGGGVIETFYDGYPLVENEEWDYIVKFDGDLSFEPDYFERCLKRFEEDPKLGVGGGLICGLIKGVMEEESKGDPRFHVRGATKIYRRECFRDIGGLLKSSGWDTLDEVKANMCGWKSYTFPELKLLHHRYSGAADGAWKNWVKNGRANYFSGYHPLFMLLKCASRVFQKPYGVAALGLLNGYVSGYIQRSPQVPDRELIRYLRRQQINRLMLRQSLWS
ncbi:MAG: glycosyltransferase [Limisphaerales bacterium]